MPVSFCFRPFLLFIILFAFLGACTLPASYSPSLPEFDIVSTQAAKTILAYLSTDDSQGSVTPLPDSQSTPQADPTQPAYTETLPATSTPLPTKTSRPSVTLQPTETPFDTITPTATFIEDQLSAELGKPSWVDSFEDNANWPLYSNKHVQMSINNGRLDLVALNADKWESWMVTWDEVANFYLETNATTEECGGLDRFGLLVRSNKSATQGYLYGITCDGRYSLRIWDGENFTALIGWTESEKIIPGSNQTNRLGLKAESDILSLYANGVLIDQVQDGSFSEGAFGVFIGAVNTPGYRVRLQDISLWILPD